MSWYWRWQVMFVVDIGCNFHTSPQHSCCVGSESLCYYSRLPCIRRLWYHIICTDILKYTCTDFRGKIRNTLKHWSLGHSWSIIDEILTEVLKCHGITLLTMLTGITLLTVLTGITAYWWHYPPWKVYWFRVLEVGGSEGKKAWNL